MLINDDAKAQLEQAEGLFDIIIGDLADPLEGGPCYQVRLHTDNSIIIDSHEHGKSGCWWWMLMVEVDGGC